jgi:hypothetical protein
MTIAASASGQTETATITLSSTAHGALSDPRASTDGSTIINGVYSVTGTAAQVTTDLRALVFTATAHEVAPGQGVTTTFSISVIDNQVASILQRHDMLAKRTEADRLYVRFIPKVGRIEPHALLRSEFGRSEREPQANAYTMHKGGHNDPLALLDAAIDRMTTAVGSRSSHLGADTKIPTGTLSILKSNTVPVVPGQNGQTHEDVSRSHEFSCLNSIEPKMGHPKVLFKK